MKGPGCGCGRARRERARRWLAGTGALLLLLPKCPLCLAAWLTVATGVSIPAAGISWGRISIQCVWLAVTAPMVWRLLYGEFQENSMRIPKLSLLLLPVLATGLWAQPRIPSGTTIVVRTIESIESKSADAGRTYSASLDEPLVVNGRDLAPKGAEVRLRVVDAKKAGKLRGNAELTIEIATVAIRQRQVPVETAEVSMQSDGKGKSSAKKIGILGGVGAAVGAIAGGGKGAAIGAGAGAAAGTGWSVLSGPQVKIPSETLLTFTTR